MYILPKSFYARDPKVVAIDLLGKVIVRKLDGERLSGIIVETEAYYGFNDPASRAYGGIKPFCRVMLEEPGTLFIYMVHGNWLLNIVTLPKGIPSAVLIRAVEPKEGIKIMLRNRRVKRIYDLTNGPGKFTKAFGITKEYNGLNVADPSSPINIIDEGYRPSSIESSHRIGVSRDLPQKLRFYIKDNPYVSKAKPRA